MAVVLSPSTGERSVSEFGCPVRSFPSETASPPPAETQSSVLPYRRLIPVPAIHRHMTQQSRFTGISRVIKRKPLQTGKFVGVLLALVLGIGGFFRIIDATALTGNSLLGDGQFLALVLIPLVSLGLVVLVFVETLVTGIRVLRSDESIQDHITGRVGYVLLRSVEAIIAVVGVAVIVTALPSLFAESTPAPAGVGIMLLLMVVGLGILFVSLVRSFAELFVYRGTDRYSRAPL